MRFSCFGTATGFLMLAAAPAIAGGPSDFHGKPLATAGLGQASPAAVNLSQDPSWQLYGFQRDGITYLQVNDLLGNVQLIIGNAGGAYWVLPAGDNLAKVSLPQQKIQIPAGASRSQIYSGSDFSLVRYRSGGEVIWSVETP
ncbi:hypothetical protein SMSKK35_1379 [Stenotrophomonas maltophilia SKK35]|nr:hypothetical protein [Stenotrophomonas maltophilia]CCP10780.1 hypothetical protein SMSKK35_1379 [Stenotrophomonas maltophilia SKK35]HDS1125088.1 hypothetical protein [Stenotrophomonas maltophilia]HEL3180945.1 hypothetical protein [Stenotrophomonas maltophilia]